MPKEVTHWLIAQQTARELQGTQLEELVASYPNCLMLGAVIHDAAYYVRDLRWQQALSGFADILHDKTGGPFAGIAAVAQAAAQTRHPGPVRALLIGMLTHIAADSCLHPLVYHATGNYHDPDPDKRSLAVQKHRGFETALDVYLAGTLATVITFSLKRYIRHLELRVSKLIQEAFAPAASDYTIPDLPDALLHGLRVFSRMQSMYAAPVLTTSVDLLYPLLPAAGREIAALFYLPRLIRQAPELHGPRTFPDPDTGRAVTASVLDLYRRAIEISLHLCRALEPCLLGKQPFSAPRMPILFKFHKQASTACPAGA